VWFLVGRLWWAGLASLAFRHWLAFAVAEAASLGAYLSLHSQARPIYAADGELEFGGSNLASAGVNEYGAVVPALRLPTHALTMAPRPAH